MRSLLYPAILLLLLSAVATPARAEKVEVIVSGSAAPYLEAQREAVRQLKRAGHEVRAVQLTKFAKELSSKGADADRFIAIGSRAARWLKLALPEPDKMVYCMVSHPESKGLEDVPGVSTDVPLSVQMALIHSALPGCRKLGMLYSSGSKKSFALKKQAEQALPDGWALHAVDVDGQDSIADSIRALYNGRPDIIFTAPDSAVYDVSVVRALLLNSVRAKIPVYGFSPAFVKAGALLGIGIDAADQGRQAGRLAISLMKVRADDEDKDEQQVSARFEIAVNLIVADKLDLDIPDRFVARATTIYRSRKGD